MKRPVQLLLVAILVGQCLVQTEASGKDFISRHLNYIANKLQKFYYAQNVVKYLKGFRFCIQPIYDYGYGPEYNVGSTYFTNYQQPKYYTNTYNYRNRPQNY